MAHDLLPIPVSIIASKSAFNLSGKTISPTYSALKPKTVQGLVCQQEWGWAEYDATLAIDDDSNSDNEVAYEGEEDDICIFLGN